MIISDNDSEELEKFFNNSSSHEYIYMRTAELIRDGKSPEEAQAEVLQEIRGIIDGSIVSEEDVDIEAGDEEKK
jgi:hypothetical protein